MKPTALRMTAVQIRGPLSAAARVCVLLATVSSCGVKSPSEGKPDPDPARVKPPGWEIFLCTNDVCDWKERELSAYTAGNTITAFQYRDYTISGGSISLLSQTKVTYVAPLNGGKVNRKIFATQRGSSLAQDPTGILYVYTPFEDALIHRVAQSVDQLDPIAASGKHAVGDSKLDRNIDILADGRLAWFFEPLGVPHAVYLDAISGVRTDVNLATFSGEELPDNCAFGAEGEIFVYSKTRHELTLLNPATRERDTIRLALPDDHLVRLYPAPSEGVVVALEKDARVKLLHVKRDGSTREFLITPEGYRFGAPSRLRIEGGRVYMNLNSSGAWGIFRTRVPVFP